MALRGSWSIMLSFWYLKQTIPQLFLLCIHMCPGTTKTTDAILVFLWLMDGSQKPFIHKHRILVSELVPMIFDYMVNG